MGMFTDLQDKRVVITGAASGIGLATARRFVEENSKEDLYRNPMHPYTQSLLKSIPENKPIKHGFHVIPGEIPSPENPPSGCYFHPRCPYVKKICKEEYPNTLKAGNALISCFLY